MAAAHPARIRIDPVMHRATLRARSYDTHGRSGRRAVAALLSLLLAASFVLDLHLALVFSPLLALLTLISADARVEAAIVELVHRLAGGREQRRARRRIAPVWRLAPVRGAHSLSPLGSRAPPRFSF